MYIHLELKDIRKEYPDLYEEVLIVSKDKTSFISAMYMCWNEATEDETFEWKTDDDVSYDLNEWPYWVIFSKDCVKGE